MRRSRRLLDGEVKIIDKISFPTAGKTPDEILSLFPILLQKTKKFIR